MAHTVATTTLLNGSKYLIVHIYLKCDGNSGELSDTTLVDPMDYGLTSDPTYTVEELVYDFAGFDAAIEFDTGLITDGPIWVLPEGGVGRVDFKPFGGFKDRSGMDGTGKLVITTTGFTATTDQGSLILKLRVN